MLPVPSPSAPGPH